MSSQSWRNHLLRTLETLPISQQAARVAVLGIGNEFNGDDAAGPTIARGLMSCAGGYDQLLVIDAGLAPENQTGALRRFAPALVILVDAAQMNAQPGEVRWIPWQETVGVSASTHTLPLHMLAHFLTMDFGCEVALLGIQPAGNQIDSPLSGPVQAATQDIIGGLTALLLGDTK